MFAIILLRSKDKDCRIRTLIVLKPGIGSKLQKKFKNSRSISKIFRFPLSSDTMQGKAFRLRRRKEPKMSKRKEDSEAEAATETDGEVGRGTVEGVGTGAGVGTGIEAEAGTRIGRGSEAEVGTRTGREGEAEARNAIIRARVTRGETLQSKRSESV